MEIYQTSLQVRYAETDQMGVVYHANYLIWFELGRTALVDSLGLDYLRLEDEEGILSPVIKAELSFLKPVRYGDQVTVKTWVDAYDGLRVTYGYEIYAQDRLCVQGKTVHVCVRRTDFRPISVRKKLPEWDAVYRRIKHN
ncbi:MAG: acyl-CoA thioesterase [Firmicutes bacterium]|nr:acyl-CoA thioesterase [Bacillota bacterium]